MYPLWCSNPSEVWKYQRSNSKHKSNKGRQCNGQEKKEQTDNDLQSYTQKINIELNESNKNPEWIHVFLTVKLYPPHLWHPSYYCCKKSDGNSWIRKGGNRDNDKGNISVFMSDKYTTEVLTCLWTNNIRSDYFH